MAELVIGPLVSMVKEKATSYLLDKYKVMEGMEEQRSILELLLPAILDVIQDAEEKAADRHGVRTWLDALRTVSYEAIDVFDEFKYEALRRDAKKKGHYTMLGMDVVSLFPSHNPIVFRYRMGKKLRRIVQTIEVLVAQMNAFGFKQLQPPPPSNQLRQTDSIMADSEEDIVSRSRKEEKDKILKILLDRVSGMDDLMVLPIVGMGGLGKTTFVQLIYNDPEIKKCFQLRRWCCVSEDFDVADIANSICMKNEKNREKAFQDLQNEVNGRKYLIVLDDVWNEDGEKWSKLKTCLQHGGKGSAILTTTRKPQVAQIMKMGMDECHNLEELGKDFLKEMIRRRAFSLPDSDQIVDKIVDRCHGSPLAAKAFGSMLSTKTCMQEWEGVLTKSNICNGTEILPILKLSYDDLPSHLKPCFAFCAVFPKDNEIEVEKLIRLWMAHDFIPPQEEDHLETKGDHLETKGVEIFKELVWRSFFQDVKQIQTFRGRTQLRSRTICKIHDLMHDIAQSVMGKQCVTITDSRNHKDLVSNPTRHLFTSYGGVGNGIWFGDFLKKQSPTFRSLLFPHGSWKNGGWQRHISKCNSLRALQLFHKEELPFTPRHLQHLRYLDLSKNWITELPEGISMLYNLQTLNLSYCCFLRRLPKDMKYMTSLRHLYTNGCTELKCMPEDLGQLTSLQTLTYFVVGASSGCSTVGELQNLNLGGELELCGLENVTEERAKAARLVNKDKLTHLSLQWRSNNSDREPLPDSHKKVLDALKPHDGIQMLRIVSYKSTGLPTWMTDLSVLKQLVELHLVGCKICEEFPQFWHFGSLEVLHLQSLYKLQNLCSGTASSAFPALKELKLLDLEILERWVSNEEDLTFPLLEKVEIRNCPKLTSFPEAPNLKVVELEEDKAQVSLSILRSRDIMSSLAKLELRVCDREATLQLDQDRDASASEMMLVGCTFFFPPSPSQPTTGIWKWFGQLVDLRIFFCDVLIYWPEEEFLCLVALKRLSIYSCSKLIGPTNRARDQLLPHLSSLEIHDCESLTELFVLPTSLKRISINTCDKLEFIWGNEDAALGSVPQEEHCNELAASTSIPEQSPAAPRNHSLPCLESLNISRCASFVTLQNLPASLKRLRIDVSFRSVSGASGQLDSLVFLQVTSCNELESLDCLGHLPSLEHLSLESCNKLESLDCLGHLPSLEHLSLERCNKLESLDCLGDLPSLHDLWLRQCKRLSSLPGVDGSYSRLRSLWIEYCPALNMKPLYERHRQRLDSLEHMDLSHAHSSDPWEGPKLRDPKSWKYATPLCRRAIQAQIRTLKDCMPVTASPVGSPTTS